MTTKIIDFHAHILPGIDDGSRNLETSCRMLELSAQQGVEMIIATPHFYASRDRVEHFLEKRTAAWQELQAELPKFPIEVRCGAEVAFFRGISKAEKLDCLKIEGTDMLLLEMPFMPWESSDLDEVESLIRDRGYHILLAHLERYLDLPGNKHRIEEILELPVSVQINAESFADWRKRGRLVKMFRDGEAQVLGSDCHSLHRRPPNLAEGRTALEKKLGKEFLKELDTCGSQLLGI